jgi:hypothetical protein
MSSARNQQADKVPSKICYDDQGNVLKWGYMVSPQDPNQAAWFKLLLSDEAREQGGDRVSATISLLGKLRKSPVDVVADYLRCLWNHAIKNIELALVKIAVDNMTFRVVLTLPANWDHNAQELTRQAAVQAGITLPRSRGATVFKTVSEPEAAALAAWRESGMRWRPDLKVLVFLANYGSLFTLAVERFIRGMRCWRRHCGELNNRSFGLFSFDALTQN